MTKSILRRDSSGLPCLRYSPDLQQAPHGKQAIHCSYVTPASSTGMNQARDCRSIRTKMNEISTSPSFRCLSDYRLFFSSASLERSRTTIRNPVIHNDVIVWGGPARLRYHGVAPLKGASHPLLWCLACHL